MCVVEPLESDSLSVFNRLICEEVQVAPGMVYKDVNDVDKETRLLTKRLFRDNETWKTVRDKLRLIPSEGLTIGRRYCIYGWHGRQLVGRVVFTENLNHPDGYGCKDFQQAKLGKFILNLVTGMQNNKDREELIQIISDFEKKNVDCVVLACTDLQLLIPRHPTLKIFDTMKIFADATVEEILK